MDFTSINFLGFLLAVALVYRIMPMAARPAILLAASWYFYYANSHGFLFLMLGESVLVFCVAIWLNRVAKRSARLPIAVGTAGLLIAAVILFKAAGAMGPGFIKGLLMPLGVSYYTFKLLGYLIDVYWEAIEPEKNFIHFVTYVSFFPQIVGGPIQRSQDFLPQMGRPRGAGRQDVLLGCQRILLGFFKKFVVADSIAMLVNFIYQNLHSANVPLFLGFYGYPLQMYSDFSALTDIAIGAALLFGITSPENFNAPFSAATPSEYWRRWHMSLTTWLTDYVFTPLRMATRTLGNAGLVLSLTANMVLIGLWHGFRWTFVLFGLVHAVYLSIDALTAKGRRQYYKLHPAQSRLSDWFGPVITFHLIALAFVFFRADNLSDAIFVIAHLLSTAAQWTPQFTAFLGEHGRTILTGVCGYAIAEIFDWLRRHNKTSPILPALPRWGRWSVYSCTAIAACLLLMLLLISEDKRSPFLYAIF